LSLNPLYTRWLDGAVGRQLPPEPRATCDDCAMCDAAAFRAARSSSSAPLAGPSLVRAPSTVAPFDPRTKCCTYLPTLPNFLVGGVIADERADVAVGRATLIARFERLEGVTPLGLGWTDAHGRMYDEDESAHFGRRFEMRCPHYLEEQGGLCGVWQHRNAICSTWFCKYERGAVGKAFWRRVQTMFEEVEDVLRWWCIDELGVSWDRRELLRARPGLLRGNDLVDGRIGGGEPTEERRRAVWGRWFGREREFFLRCHEMTRDLAWDDLQRIAGHRLHSVVHDVREGFERRETFGLPPRLWRAEAKGTPQGASVLFEPYRAYDAVVLSVDEAACLDRFDGRKSREILAETGVSEDTAQRWLDYGLLVDAEPRRPGRR
jgi:hypothetical protein